MDMDSYILGMLNGGGGGVDLSAYALYTQSSAAPILALKSDPPSSYVLEIDLDSAGIPVKVDSASPSGTIGDYFFSGRTEITSIEIGENITSIGDNAFEGCEALSNVVVDGSIASVGDFAFYGCTGLQSLPDGFWESLETVGASAFNGCSSLVLPGSLELDSIGDKAFFGCAGVDTQSTTPFLLTCPSIGAQAFSNVSCDYVAVASAGSIGTKAFRNLQFFQFTTKPTGTLADKFINRSVEQAALPWANQSAATSDGYPWGVTFSNVQWTG